MERTQLVKHVRPPTKKDQGKKLRRLKPIPTTRTLVQENLSVQRGLPENDSESGIKRLTPGGAVAPKKTSVSRDVITVKLQDPEHVSSLMRLHERIPTRGQGAAKLILAKSEERRGLKGSRVAMATSVHMTASIPKHKAAQRRLAYVTYRWNIVFMDENSNVTFGVMEEKYPPWYKQQLRAEIFKAFIAMGQRRLPVCPVAYEAVRAKLADSRLCGPHWENSLSLPTTVEQPPPSLLSRKRTASSQASPRTATKKQKAAANVRGTVSRIVRQETGPWGKRRKLETWYVAEWDHSSYEPWWEQWRNAGGAPGTPVLTWMGLREARRYLAFNDWVAARAPNAQG